MIYVEEKRHERQFELLLFLANLNDCKICAWLYPESSSSKVAEFQVVDNVENLIPVTSYEDGFIPKRTLLVDASKINILSYSSTSSEVREKCDSLALYKDNEVNWFVVTIGHEGMCLVQDDDCLDTLVNAGFSASIDAPSWW